MDHAMLNLSMEKLVEYALEKKEGELAGAHGPLVVKTGARTGRSPSDRFIVRDEITDATVDWGSVNQPLEPTVFQKLWQKAEKYIQTRPHFISDLQVGADHRYATPVKVITELAWHQLFVQHLFIEKNSAPQKPWTLLCAPNLHTEGKEDGVNSDGCVILNFSERKILIIGIAYAGEMKKAMFSVMNFILPEYDVLPMHCSANIGDAGDVALFFGLSGTGKTTLSADPNRHLIGDDEHGWSKEGVFNFEGGCYAKCINLSKEKEPLIWNAIRYGAVVENVVLDPKTKQIKYEDASITENTRAAYPRRFIEKHQKENQASPPNVVIFLSCDLFGVLPPIAKLSEEQAAYYFLSGYTALVGSTEMGQVSGVKPTFSTCFGAPFFPRRAQEYADLLIKRIRETKADVYLVNTGWTGGAYGVGERFSIPVTRKVVDAILSGEAKHAEFDTLPIFNFKIPKKIAGIDSKLLDPRKAWGDEKQFLNQAKELAEKFANNFKKFKVTQKILDAMPMG